MPPPPGDRRPTREVAAFPVVSMGTGAPSTSRLHAPSKPSASIGRSPARGARRRGSPAMLSGSRSSRTPSRRRRRSASKKPWLRSRGALRGSGHLRQKSLGIEPRAAASAQGQAIEGVIRRAVAGTAGTAGAGEGAGGGRGAAVRAPAAPAVAAELGPSDAAEALQGRGERSLAKEDEAEPFRQPGSVSSCVEELITDAGASPRDGGSRLPLPAAIAQASRPGLLPEELHQADRLSRGSSPAIFAPDLVALDVHKLAGDARGRRCSCRC